MISKKALNNKASPLGIYAQECASIPDNKILKFDFKQLSELAKRQLIRLLNKIERERTKKYGRREHLYRYEINKLLLHEGIVIKE